MEFPAISDVTEVPTGDMPGDRVRIEPGHLDTARAVFPELWRLVGERVESRRSPVVVSVAGGSGVGKSEVGSLLAYGLRAHGLGSYVLSGDNYPRRMPASNDAERLRRFRLAGVHGLLRAGLYDADVRDELRELTEEDRDADPQLVASRPWLRRYQGQGRRALRDYLGTPEEIDFDEINAILADFHSGAPSLVLKRMGRAPADLWYEQVDVSAVQVLVVEWTHGLSQFLDGVDIAILLNSTPEQTAAHRRARNRDGAVDSPFTTMVLELEQEKLRRQAYRAQLIVAKTAELLSFEDYLQAMGDTLPGAGPMLNLYPDSLAATLHGLAGFVSRPEVAGSLESVYLLPSLYNSDLDRGFSVIDYGLNEQLASADDLDALQDEGLDLKLDFVCNHASVLSPQFQDLLSKGDASEYADFFIDWNRFWAGMGTMTSQGYIEPREDLIADMFFRKPGLPILMVRLPNGQERPYWNTFYQQTRYTAPEPEDLLRLGMQYARAVEIRARIMTTLEQGGGPGDVDFTGFERDAPAVRELLESRRHYLGQMDLNINSGRVWQFYAQTLDTLACYGARIVRLDAFAYAPKQPGARNFLNEPGTWELLAGIKELADQRGLVLLPEIHSRYDEGIHRTIADQGFLGYDFFLPGLLIDAFERRDSRVLRRWIGELVDGSIHTVNMLGCHDGIPLLDLRGLLDDERIGALIEVVKGRGGLVKDLHGQKKTYYQVNASYFSALGESEPRLLLARAIQLFMPGKPQIWYLDLFAGTNDYEAVRRGGEGAHKEINRTNISASGIEAGLRRRVVRRQLELLRFRAECPAFGFDAECEVEPGEPQVLALTWRRSGHSATLHADLASEQFHIDATNPDGTPGFSFDSRRG